jgi:hypothetical protein
MECMLICCTESDKPLILLLALHNVLVQRTQPWKTMRHQRTNMRIGLGDPFKRLACHLLGVG